MLKALRVLALWALRWENYDDPESLTLMMILIRSFASGLAGIADDDASLSL
jgi:hypothetical protein